MITEHVLLPVVPGEEDAFEVAFERATALVSAMPGFIDLSLSRCVEEPSTYLLLIGWDSIEAHTEGFRGSPEYAGWRRLLHHFYEPFPVVQHFTRVLEA